jgi:hypothetical protein
MIPVGALVSGAVAEVVRKAPLTPEKVAFAWRMAVGPTIENVTTAKLDAEGVLHVTATTPDWAAAVRKSSKLIHYRMQGLLGEATVARLQITSK